jgi:hypothetical protein
MVVNGASELSHHLCMLASLYNQSANLMFSEIPTYGCVQSVLPAHPEAGQPFTLESF